MPEWVPAAVIAAASVLLTSTITIGATVAFVERRATRGETRVEMLIEQMRELKTNIATLTAQDGRLASLETRVEGAVERVDRIEPQLTTHGERISALDARMRQHRGQASG